jgi:hypothetical protein
MNKKLIGEMTISEAYPYLNVIAKTYGLKLYKVKDFKFARLLLANLYSREMF